MKKMKLLVPSLCVLFLFSSMVSCQNITLDEILDNHFETIGQAALDNVQTMIIKGKSSGRQGDNPFTIHLKRPNKTRNESNMMGMNIVRGFDGENSWVLRPEGQGQGRGGGMGGGRGGGGRMGQGDTRYFGSQLYNWKDKGFKLVYSGTVNMEGTEVYKLKLTDDNDRVTNFFLDAESFVILKTTSVFQRQEMSMEIATYYSNYEIIDGIAFAFSTETVMGERGGSTQTIESIELDVEIEDSMFEDPNKE